MHLFTFKNYLFRGHIAIQSPLAIFREANVGGIVFNKHFMKGEIVYFFSGSDILTVLLL